MFNPWATIPNGCQFMAVPPEFQTHAFANQSPTPEQLHAAQSMMMAMPFAVPFNAFPMPMNSIPAANEIADDASDDEEVDDEQQRTLFVGNLDDRVTDELLYEVFLQAGPIETVRIPKDNGGRQRSFGFVTYTHTCTPVYAEQLLQGLKLFRRSLTIRCQAKRQEAPANNHATHRNEPAQHRRSGDGDNGGAPPKFDNSSLRSANFGAFAAATLAAAGNPFKSTVSTGKDWTMGSAAQRRSAGSSEVRHSPYERESPRDNRQRDNDRRRSEGSKRRSHDHHKDGNRRSNQRKNFL